VTRPQKIMLGEMRAIGVRGVLGYWSDYHCSHSIAISTARWPDQLRLSELESLFVFEACGTKGLQVKEAAARKSPVLSGGIGRGFSEERPSTLAHRQASFSGVCESVHYLTLSPAGYAEAAYRRDLSKRLW
jgi:hypothetical protein